MSTAAPPNSSDHHIQSGVHGAVGIVDDEDDPMDIFDSSYGGRGDDDTDHAVPPPRPYSQFMGGHEPPIATPAAHSDTTSNRRPFINVDTEDVFETYFSTIRARTLAHPRGPRSRQASDTNNSSTDTQNPPPFDQNGNGGSRSPPWF
ncbi:hypothetical protein ONZ45_g16031 [Pleurotus djamor]|nr:hypothetical protein ONZ45_g16031 [Pleurotus djamor]